MGESDEQAWARHQELEEHLFGRSPVSFSDVLAGLSPLDDNDASASTAHEPATFATILADPALAPTLDLGGQDDPAHVADTFVVGGGADIACALLLGGGADADAVADTLVVGGAADTTCSSLHGAEPVDEPGLWDALVYSLHGTEPVDEPGTKKRKLETGLAKVHVLPQPARQMCDFQCQVNFDKPEPAMPSAHPIPEPRPEPAPRLAELGVLDGHSAASKRRVPTLFYQSETEGAWFVESIAVAGALRGTQIWKRCTWQQDRQYDLLVTQRLAADNRISAKVWQHELKQGGNLMCVPYTYNFAKLLADDVKRHMWTCAWLPDDLQHLARESASSVLKRSLDAYRKLKLKYTQVKVGITANPGNRCPDYMKENYRVFALIHTSWELGLIEMLETALIMLSAGSTNNELSAGGGGGAMGHTGRAGPFWLYMAAKP
jgi:hypothetical protein